MPSRIVEGTDYAEIGLTKGKIALVSLVDFEIVKYNWFCHSSAQERAMARIANYLVYMHHIVLRRAGLLVGINKETDHINCNTLDNRRENLRWVDHHTNMRNTDRHKNRIGVMCHNSGNWHAYLNYPDHVVVSLGYWKTREKALEIVEEAKKIQASCPTKAEFLLIWNFVKPRKQWERGGM